MHALQALPVLNESLVGLFPALLNFIHDAVIIWELEGGIVFWNQAAVELYGYSVDEARGQVTHELLNTRLPCGIPELEATLCRDGAWSGQLDHTTRAGEHVMVDSRIALLLNRNGTWLVLEANRKAGPAIDRQDSLNWLPAAGELVRLEIAPAASRLANLLRRTVSAIPIPALEPGPEIEPPVPVPPRKFTARCEPFDTYWQGSRNLAQDYRSFGIYYRVNYLPHLPPERQCRILVTSCGPGYLVNALVRAGYRNVLGIDSDENKVKHAQDHGLPCEEGPAFAYLQAHPESFDVIIPEQELNHLTIEETIEFLQLCHRALKPGGEVLVYAINGANPLVAPEHISHNIDHFYNVTDYSLTQLLTLGGFRDIKPFGCRLYVFWTQPLNYVGLAVTTLLELGMRAIYKLYGKKVSIFSKRIAATARK
jgi:SAM-dependent methyltransferase